MTPIRYVTLRGGGGTPGYSKRNITRLHKTEINVIVAENKTANVNDKRKP